MRDGFWIRITAEADQAWQRAMTTPKDPKEIAARTKSEGKTKARGKKAGDLSAASPRHVSKQRKRSSAA
jgi:hypothetical protein